MNPPTNKGNAEAIRFLEELENASRMDAEAYVADMTPEQAVQFTREFLFLMQDWQPHAIDLENKSLEGAAHGMFLALMFPEAFKKAYTFSNNYLLAQSSIKRALGEEE